MGRGGRACRRRAEAGRCGVRPRSGAVAGRHARRDQAPQPESRLQQPVAVAAGRLHHPDAQPRQLGRPELGRQACVGLRAGGRDDAGGQSLSRHRRQLGVAAFLGLRPRVDPASDPGDAGQPPLLLAERDRPEVGLRLPRPQLRGGGARRQVDPHPSQHRRGAAVGDRVCVDQRGLLRQGIHSHPLLRLRQVRGLRARQGRRRSQDARVGLGEVRRHRVDHQGAGARLGEQDHQPHSRQRGSRHQRALLLRAGSVGGHASRHVAASANPACIRPR